jgi:hypothetical protein
MFSFSPREKVSRDATDEGLVLHAAGVRPSPVCSAATLSPMGEGLGMVFPSPPGRRCRGTRRMRDWRYTRRALGPYPSAPQPPSPVGRGVGNGFSFSPREKVSRDATDEGLALHAAGVRPSPVCSAATPRSLAKHSASPPLRARGSTPGRGERGDDGGNKKPRCVSTGVSLDA